MTSHALTGLAGAIAVDALVKASLFLLIVALGMLGLRRASASIRYMTWSVSFVGLLILPLLAVLVPPIVLGAGPQTSTAVELTATPVQGDHAPTPAAAGPVATVSVVEPLPSVDIRSVAAAGFVIVWMLGALWLLLQLVYGLRFIAGVVARARPAPFRAQCLADELRAQLGVRGIVRVLISDDIAVPASTGAIRPAVLLPLDVDSWSTEQLQVVLAHELGHIARHDLVWHLAMEAVRALYWVNPLVWFGARRMSVERERSCDDMAVALGVPAHVYASHLVAIAKTQLRRPEPVGIFRMARHSDLRERLAGLVTAHTARRPATAWLTAGAVLVGASAVTPIAALELWQASIPTFEEAIDNLEHHRATDRRLAAWWLGQYENRAATSGLIQRLADEEPDVRLVAAWALGEIKDPTAIDPLIEVLQDDDPFVREMAVLALGELESEDAVTALVRAADADAASPRAVAWALGEIDAERAAGARAQLSQRFAEPLGENEETWATSADRVRFTPSGDVEELVGMLRNDGPTGRRVAAHHLGLAGDHAAVEALLDALRDPAPEVRAAAVWALDEINPTRN